MPPRIVQGPDGKPHSFPADATDAEISAALQSVSAASAAPTATEPAQTDTSGVMERLRQLIAQLPSAASDAAGGVRAGAASTVYGGGDLIRRSLGMERVINRPEVKAAMTPPDSAAGKAGYHGEQIGEFFIPTGVAGKLSKVAEIAKSAGLSAAQSGGDLATTGLSAGLTALVPGASGVAKISGSLESAAQKEMAMALGATKEWAKSEAARLAPDMLKRGVSGSRDAMLDLAKSTAARVGTNLENAYTAAAAAGHTVPSTIIAGNVQLARDALQVRNAAGRLVTIPGTEPIIAKLDELATFVQSMGADIPVDKAAHIKRVWDALVSKAGLFGPKATASATDNGAAWAIREASNSFRSLINSNPTLAALNSESAFWTGLKKVLKETQKRTQAQAGTGLVQAGMGGAGTIAGALSGDSAKERATNAVIGGLAGRQLVKWLQSPVFRTSVSGPAKQFIADALASGNAARITAAVGQITAALPAQLRPAFQP